MTDPVYGNPLAEMWGCVMAADEALHGPLVMSPKAFRDREAGSGRRRRQRARQQARKEQG